MFSRTKHDKAHVLSTKWVNEGLLNAVEVHKYADKTHVIIVLDPSANVKAEVLQKALRHTKYDLQKIGESPSYDIVSPEGMEVAHLTAINRICFQFNSHATNLDLLKETHFRNIILTLLSGNQLA